ncbi:MAG: cell wall hydrolase [Lachnospiraceae bacterium]|nr:cell wall hydrolase [Lachnospiraceae bacterium]
MYKKFVTQLFLCNMLFLAGWFCVKGIQVNRLASMPAFQISLAQNYEEPKADKFFGILKRASSGQRVVDYEVLEREDIYNLSDKDYEVLLKIVQAEAGNEDEKGKMLVAGVVMNRVNSSRFPNTVEEVVFQHKNDKYQFSPVANGSYYSVKVSEETKEAVGRVLKGEDMTEGALYFAARKYADDENMKWFDRSLKRLFEYGGHEFFTYG